MSNSVRNHRGKGRYSSTNGLHGCVAGGRESQLCSNGPERAGHAQYAAHRIDGRLWNAAPKAGGSSAEDSKGTIEWRLSLSFARPATREGTTPAFGFDR